MDKRNSGKYFWLNIHPQNAISLLILFKIQCQNIL
jgi:hypothetical protein